MTLRLDVRSGCSSAILGLGIGLIGGPVFMLIPWALTGILLGWLTVRAKAALVNGAIYGFVLSFTFMISGYDGSDPLLGKLLPFIALGVFGAFCGACWSVPSYYFWHRWFKV